MPKLIKTHQKMSMALPPEKNQNLGLMITCGNCLAARTFKIDDALKTLENRETAGHVYKTECEECGHSIAVILGWIDASKPGYSYRKMDFSPKQNMVICADENGLKGNQKRK